MTWPWSESYLYSFSFTKLVKSSDVPAAPRKSLFRLEDTDMTNTVVWIKKLNCVLNKCKEWQVTNGNGDQETLQKKKKKKKHISGEHQVLLLVEQDYQEQEGNLKPDTGVKKGTGEDNETQEKTKNVAQRREDKK